MMVFNHVVVVSSSTPSCLGLSFFGRKWLCGRGSMRHLAEYAGCAIVTGGSNGIGSACVKSLVERRQMKVYNLDLTPPSTNRDMYEQHGVEFLCTNMGCEESVKQSIQQIIAREKRIHVLVNNVGIQPKSTCVPLHTLSSEAWDNVLRVNLNSMFYASKYVIQNMLDSSHQREGNESRSCTGSNGVIINMASVQGVLSQPGVPAYAASKGAMLSLTRQMALEYGPQSIRVVAVNPGTVETPLVKSLIEGAGKSMKDAGSVYPYEKRVGQPEEVGNVVAFLTTPDASFITGSHVDVDGGICVKGGWNT
eukprot:m.15869 g.15869  ORF g.15869 m.15869 type:complete len:307 (-) comp4536_c0_seq2:120-1040(-)